MKFFVLNHVTMKVAGVLVFPFEELSPSAVHENQSSFWCRIASGDAEGQVAVWDAHTGLPVAVLEDPWLAATGRRGDPQAKLAGVKALAWVLSDPSVLAIALSNMLIIWNPQGIVLPMRSLATKKQTIPQSQQDLSFHEGHSSLSILLQPCLT